MKNVYPLPKLVVKVFDITSQKIIDYDIITSVLDTIKKIKKKSKTKGEFQETLLKEFMYRYWSRAEHELVIAKTEDNRILLLPWCGCRDINKSAIDVTDDATFNWNEFADEHIKKQVFKVEAKIDVYDQITFENRFETVSEELWNIKLPYERSRK